MTRTNQWLGDALRRRQRSLASVAATVFVASSLVAVSHGLGPGENSSFADTPGVTAPVVDPSLLPEGATIAEDGTIIGADGVPLTPGEVRKIIGGKDPSLPSAPSVDTPVVSGVTDDTIEVVYYWKGERTQTSPFLRGTAAEGANLDEEQAFNAYIDYINKHSDGSATFFGIPINLHGRKLVGRVLAPNDAGSGDAAYAPIAERIAKEIKPFAAVASHGSISSYICPYLAEHGIFNLQTYDLGGLHPRTGKPASLVERTNGYCTPAGLSWERQIDLTIAYLKQDQDTRTETGQKRVYGVIYSVYPGLTDVGERMVQRLKDAGIPIAHHRRLPASLSDGQTQAQGILLEMREKNVNTLIMPEAGSPLTITHAAQAQQYYPDYFVWPCSGNDVTGMVRLLNPTQWEGAQGLTCYDREFNPDAVNTSISRRSEWWKAYKEVRPNAGDPPAPSPLVYSGLYQLVAGITFAGPDLTPETFKAGLDRVPRYRYDTVDGRTDDPMNMLLTLPAGDRSMIGDVGELRWDATASEGGAQGAYRYLGVRRYASEADF